MPISNPRELRLAVRSGQFTGHTSGHCRGFVQGNVVILPESWADEFLRFCQLNPKPCPLIAVSDVGQYSLPSLGVELDIRSDVPCYRVFEEGRLVDEPVDITAYWRQDLVTFVLGCSFSFEEALLTDGLEVRNISEFTLSLVGSLWWQYGGQYASFQGSRRYPGDSGMYPISQYARCPDSLGRPGPNWYRAARKTGFWPFGNSPCR